MGSARSTFRDIESCFRIGVSLGDDCIQLVLKQYNSNFVTYELTPSIYTIKDIFEAVYTMGDHEGTAQLEYDDVSMKKKFFKLVLVVLFECQRLIKNLHFAFY